uniref:HTH psq-type domain-containing protein n=1 Tax=Sinocyclocheilus grahami TaxID=75366 RepID=A0A672M102_SINGR
MGRHYKRKTNWGSTPIEDMERAANDVMGGKSIRAVTKEKNIDRSTLCRYMKTTGYSGTAEAKRVFTEELEKELTDHIKKLADQNNIPVPNNWKEKGLAGRDWFNNFKACHHLSCHIPEATSVGRASAFNKTTVEEFFNNLAKVIDR